jgi:hypothetical protein
LHLRAQVEWKIIEFVFKLIYLNFALWENTHYKIYHRHHLSAHFRGTKDNHPCAAIIHPKLFSPCTTESVPLNSSPVSPNGPAPTTLHSPSLWPPEGPRLSGTTPCLCLHGSPHCTASE